MTKIEITRKALALLGYDRFQNCTAEQFARKHTKSFCEMFLRSTEETAIRQQAWNKQEKNLLFIFLL